MADAQVMNGRTQLRRLQTWTRGNNSSTDYFGDIEMACIGIDLGTTNSLIAVFDEKGPRLLPNALDEVMTPSVVGLADDAKTLLVGRPARARLVRHPDRTAARFKRLMGTDKPLRLGSRSYTAVELSAFLLRSLKADAEAQLGEPVTGAVISVPAYFNGKQRQATKDAAELAGLTVLGLINEPTAAALAAGVQDQQDESTFIVLDLGGGTFDVSIIEMFEGVMEVRASSGDAFLGGEDFTAIIARHFATEAGLEWDRADPTTREALLTVADDIKRRLTSADRAESSIAISGKQLDVSLDLSRFEELTQGLVARIRRPIEASIYDSGVQIDQIDRVLLVGGATRMPVIRSLAARIFRQLPERKGDPDHVVALGAAVQAGLIARHSALKDMVMTDVAPFSLGIAANNEINGRIIPDRFAPLIERNTVLPVSRSGVFVTMSDNQTTIRLTICQGESAVASENIKLGEMNVPVPRAPKGREAVEVRFTYDTSGLLAVDATTLSTGLKRTDVIENLAEAMSESDKKRRLKDMEALKISPRDHAENVALVESLKHLYAMLLGTDRDYLATLLNEFDLALVGQDVRHIAAERERINSILREIEAGYVR